MIACFCARVSAPLVVGHNKCVSMRVNHVPQTACQAKLWGARQLPTETSGAQRTIAERVEATRLMLQILSHRFHTCALLTGCVCFTSTRFKHPLVNVLMLHSLADALQPPMDVPVQRSISLTILCNNATAPV
jgi:hypothetical protein